MHVPSKVQTASLVSDPLYKYLIGTKDIIKYAAYVQYTFRNVMQIRHHIILLRMCVCANARNNVCTVSHKCAA